MITQIEIDGFKTFKDFKVELAPFQVIVGPNGSGKSNLFDALHLLSRLAEFDLQSAFQSSYDDPQRLRGDAHELFTLFPNGQRSNYVRIAVEMLVDRKVQDDFGREFELSYTRLRYEVEVILRKDKPDWEVLCVAHEALKTIPESEDSWCKTYGISSQNGWLPSSPDSQKIFISTTLPKSHTRVAEAAPRYEAEPHEPSVSPTTVGTTIHLHSDGQSRGKTAVADKMKRTILSSMADAEFPHAFAVRKEMQSWQYLHLSHAALHQPSATKAWPYLLSDGSNLPTTLARIRSEDEFAFHCVSLDMANLVPGILDIEIEEDQGRNQYIISAKDADARSFSGYVLSDGTLRLLALATIRNDPQFHGVLCLEEPENGVNPLRFKNMALLLREMATDFKDEQQIADPLRQIVVTTHSPTFIGQPDVVDALLFAFTVMRVEPLSSGNPSLEVTRMMPVMTANTSRAGGIKKNKAIEAYTIDQVRDYLDSSYLEEAQKHLEQGRALLSEK